VPNSKFLDVND